MSATLDRIRKLLNLAADSGATESEADTARRLAERLMAAANLSHDDIAAVGTDPLATFGDERVEAESAGWHGVVAMAVARVVGCAVYKTRDLKASYRVWVGTEGQREAAIALFGWVVEQINRMAVGARRSAAANVTSSSRAWLGAYRVGVAQAIARQAMELVEARKVSDDQTPGLVRLSDIEAKIAAYGKEHKLPRLTTGRTSSYKSREHGAFAAGSNDGSSIRLQRDLGKPVLRLGSGSSR